MPNYKNDYHLYPIPPQTWYDQGEPSCPVTIESGFDSETDVLDTGPTGKIETMNSSPLWLLHVKIAACSMVWMLHRGLGKCLIDKTDATRLSAIVSPEFVPGANTTPRRSEQH